MLCILLIADNYLRGQDVDKLSLVIVYVLYLICNSVENGTSHVFLYIFLCIFSGEMYIPWRLVSFVRLRCDLFVKE